MKKLLFTVLVATSSCMSFAQNTIPQTGNVGIRTQSPTEALEVMGTVKIDSCLIVKDTTVLEKDVHVKEKMVVDGKIVMKSNSVAEQNLKVEGTAKFEGNMKLMNPQIIGTNHTPSFLVLNDNGVARTMDKSALLREIYEVDCNPLGDTPTGTLYPAPVWQSTSVANQQTGYLFTGTQCPAFVGIGTDTPLHSLDVRGRGYFSSFIGIGGQPNSSAQVLAETTREVGYCIDFNHNSDFGYAFKALIDRDQSKGIGIFNENYGKDIFTVYGNGKVEISNSSEKILQLESNGLLRARSIRVDTDQWADYVFAEDYEPMNLTDLESYIEENNHLPNVPSEEEVLENGIEVSETISVLLEKIEELTLYTIEQNKLIEGLQQRVSELESE